MGDLQERLTNIKMENVSIQVGLVNQSWMGPHFKRLYDRVQQPQDPLFRVSLAQYEKVSAQRAQGVPACGPP